MKTWIQNIANIILRQALKVSLLVVLFVLVVPASFVLLAEIEIGMVLALLTSTLILQAAASPVGLHLGFEPVIILVIMTSIAVGTVVGVFEICETFSRTSQRVQRWLSKVEVKMEGYDRVHRYGAISCIFIAWIPGIGLFGTPVVAWLFRWKRLPTAIFTAIGFLLASILMLLLAMGIISLR
ncbi:MAG: hypothetical protein ACP5C4_04295 [Methanomicrobiales archaeon]